jgi:hypothetical protein
MKWIQQCEVYLSEKNLRNLLAVHFSICSAGLIVVLMYIAGLLGQAIHLPEYLYSNLYPWTGAPAVGGKTTSLLQYVLPVVVMFAYYPLFVILIPIFFKAEEKFDKDRFPRMWAYFLVVFVVNAALLLANKEKMALIGTLSIIWLLLFLWLPLSILRKRWLTIPMPKWLLAVVLGVITIQYASIFLPLITNPVVIGNDYLNISEKTILKSGMVVDNFDFINEHKIVGPQLYDPRKRKSLGNLAVKAENPQMEYGTLNTVDPSRLFSGEEMDFIDRNEVRSEAREAKGWFLYHHNYNFGPMYALSLGASPDKQAMVYGWLSTVTQGQLLESLGMMNYQGYFKEYFSAYLVCFAIFLLGIWLIFKRLDTLAFAGILAISALLELGIELIKLAPGFNPVRHIFDVPVFYLLYRYLALDRKAYLLYACGLAIFSILWSKDFGLYLSLSVGVAVLFKGIKLRPFQQVPIYIGGTMLVVGSLLYFYPMPGSNPTAIYMLMGVGSPQATAAQIFPLLVWVGVLLAATIWVKQSESYKVLTVGMALYFVMSLTYYIWYPSLHHIWGVAPVFILWIAALYHGWMSNIQDKRKIATLQTLVFAPLLLVYLAAFVHFYKYQHSYNQTFATHELYHWPFENASFTSTIDPELFEDATNLIKQYSPDIKGIYIISKYDHILPILAGKYSAMPYNELLTNLASPKEVDVAAKAVLTNKPAFLFVDSDIGHSVNIKSALEREDKFVHLHDLFGSAIYREGDILSPLNMVYRNVADQYKKCASGKLISVYCRSTD